MQQLTIRMPEEYLSGIEQIAKLTGLKKSDVTRMAIRKFIEEYEGEKEINHYGRAKNLIGVVESGISDLGQNHRNYLIRIIKFPKPGENQKPDEEIRRFAYGLCRCHPGVSCH